MRKESSSRRVNEPLFFHGGVVCMLAATLGLGCVLDVSTDAPFFDVHDDPVPECPQPATCQVPASGPASGCEEELAPPGQPCDDGDPTTHSDICDSDGICAGILEQCPLTTACIPSYVIDDTGCIPQALPAGTPCDDGDSTTIDDVCSFDGVCAGSTLHCPSASECVSSFTFEDGVCVPDYRPTGTPCDDGDTETHNTTCDGFGQCVDASCALAPIIFLNNAHERTGDVILDETNVPHFVLLESKAGRVAWVKATLNEACDSVTVELSEPSSFPNMCFNHNLQDPCAPVVSPNGGFTHNCSSPINFLFDGVESTLSNPTSCTEELRECFIEAGNGTELFAADEETLAKCVSECILFNVDENRTCHWAEMNVKY